MKQKKTRLIALLLGLCLAAGAAGGLTVSAAESGTSGTTVTASKTVSSTGWVIENGKKYYLKSNGKKLLKTGLLKIDGKYYFFNADHSVFVNGWKTIDG